MLLNAIDSDEKLKILQTLSGEIPIIGSLHSIGGLIEHDKALAFTTREAKTQLKI